MKRLCQEQSEKEMGMTKMIGFHSGNPG